MKINSNIAVSSLIACFISLQVQAGDDDTSLDNWSVSGYAKFLASALNNKPTALELDDLSIFVSGKVNAWVNPFLEAEAYSMPLWEESKGLGFDSGNLVIERLYNEFQINDSNALRIGKFLAPINHWNIVHAAPLVWSVNRPLTSRYAAANYVTGISARHDVDLISGQALEIYWQPQDEFSPKTINSHPRHYNSIIGGRWILHEGLDGYYGIAAQRAAVKNSDETRTTVSADVNWQFEDIELESELSLTMLGTAQAHVRDKEWGGFLQLVAPLINHFYAIGRYEHFEFAHYERSMDSGLGGIVFRPQPNYSFKLEWQQTFGEKSQSPTGLYGSIAVLF